MLRIISVVWFLINFLSFKYIVLDLLISFKDITVNYHTPIPSFLLTFYITVVPMSQLMHQDWYLIPKVHALLEFPEFLPNVLFLSQDLIQVTTLHLVIGFPQASLDWQLLKLTLFWWPWQFWRHLVRCFVECPSLWVWLMFFSWLVRGFVEFGDENHRGSHDIVRRVCITGVT